MIRRIGEHVLYGSLTSLLIALTSSAVWAQQPQPQPPPQQQPPSQLQQQPQLQQQQPPQLQQQQSQLQQQPQAQQQPQLQQQPPAQQQPQLQSQQPQAQQPRQAQQQTQQPQPQEPQQALQQRAQEQSAAGQSGEQDIDIAAAAPRARQQAQQITWNSVRILEVKPDHTAEFEALLTNENVRYSVFRSRWSPEFLASTPRGMLDGQPVAVARELDPARLGGVAQS